MTRDWAGLLLYKRTFKKRSLWLTASTSEGQHALHERNIKLRYWRLDLIDGSLKVSHGSQGRDVDEKENGSNLMPSPLD